MKNILKTKFQLRHFTAILYVGALTSCVSMAQSVADATTIPLEIKGNLKQSGVVIGKTIPFAKLDLDGVKFSADEDGYFVMGFDRDEKAFVSLTLENNGQLHKRSFEITPREYDVTEVNGLPPKTIEPPKEEEARIAAEKVIKTAAWASLDAEQKGFLETFRWPLDNVRITSNWGAVRKLNGTLGRPHYGVDLGAPTGTPIYAPASGKVVIAQMGFFYEGGLVGIDHGQGLISYTMHMSKVSVKTGDVLSKGDVLGAVGSTGRSTGPHLHWSLRWHGRQLDPALMVRPLLTIK